MTEFTIRPYAKSIKDISTLAFDLGIMFNPIGNFTMLPIEGGNWLCYIRRFQYYITSYGRYRLGNNMRIDDPDKHIFALLDKDFNLIRRIANPVSTYYIDPIFNKEKPYLEDGRLIQWNDGIYLALATFYQDNQQWQKFGMEIQKLELHEDGIHALHHYNSLESGIDGRQKNWMAIPDMPYNFVTGTTTNGVQVVDISTNEIKTGGIFDLSDLYRGNSNLIETDTGYMTICHRQLHDDDGRTYYANYLVEYNKDLSVKRISKPFKFTNEFIEFVTHFTIQDGDFMIGITAMDDTPEIHFYDQKEFIELTKL